MNDACVLIGDCRHLLSMLPANSVHCCVTSPPYFGLRDYGTGTWEGGSPECDHVETVQNLNSGFNERWGNSPGDRKQENCRVSQYRGICGKCGATRRDRQIGLESTLEAYINELMTVFAEVKRVLRDDGTLWLNLGDSFASSGGIGSPHRDSSGGIGRKGTRGVQPYHSAGGGFTRPSTIGGSIKCKDLMGVPWRVAFALQEDGWYLRSDIIWSKGNPMPESVTDRPTRSHEYLFLLTKNPKYYYDHEAIKEEGVYPAGTKGAKGSAERAAVAGVNARPPEYKVYDGFRNKRSVWSINTRPYKGAHFATFPPALVEPCVLAGCPTGEVVLDPFAGSGTTGEVALRLGRRAVLIELNPDYRPLIEARLGGGVSR